MRAFILCYNNGWLAADSAKALCSKFPFLEVFVVDGSSNPESTVQVKEAQKKSEFEIISIHPSQMNPWIVERDAIFNWARTETCIFTDPDLGLHSLPEDSIEKFLTISYEFNARKVGPALDIHSNPSDIIEGVYSIDGRSIREWEEQFWSSPIISQTGEKVYKALIDTTFCVFSPCVHIYNDYRVAGKYTVKHLPWHKSFLKSLRKDLYDQYYKSISDISSTSKLVKKYYESIQ